MLVHGSAPFNLDGRVPLAGLNSPYAQTSFYRDLSDGLRLEGWSVLRYSKPGVDEGGVDLAEYATTDVAVLGRQLQDLWSLLPAGRPRIVFAWSEGTLHVRVLPLREIDALVLLGGIATNIGDVIQAQGGPSPESLRMELAGTHRREMLGTDRPVGRLLDELSLVEAKTKAGEKADINFEQFHEFVRSKTEQLKKQMGCRKVEYEVSVEGGQVRLKAKGV